MGKIPHWHKGKKCYDDISGYWYGDRTGKLSRQRGILVAKESRDSLTDEQRLRTINNIAGKSRARKPLC